MPILALDTATVVSSVAVASKEKLFAELTVQVRLTHSETLLPHVQEVLKLAGVEKKDLEGVAVSIGPGSFTGLRIGLATAKGLSYALGIPIVGVPTMEALAAHFPVPGVLSAPLIDAQKGNAYAALYAWEDGILREEEKVRVMGLREVLARFAQEDRPVMLLGDMIGKKPQDFIDLPKNLYLAPPHMRMPRAANVAALGLCRLAAGGADNAMDLAPAYLRRSEAEVLWEKRHGRA